MAVGCVLCGSHDFEIVSTTDRHGQPLQTGLCGGCGVLRNDPVPTDAELAQFYRKDYRQSYKGAAEPRLRQVWRNLERLNGHFVQFRDVYAAPGRWLDLGSGSGEFTYLAQSIGADVVGVEPNEGYATYCRDKLGLQIAVQTLEETEFADGSFDLIRLSHVLEHMRDPVASLTRLKGWLKPGGMIYIEVPDIEQDARHKLRGRMFHYGHIYNYNPVTLRHVAGLAGLVEVQATAARSAGRCGGFFTVGAGGAAAAGVLAANAARMREAMAEHNGRMVPKPVEGSALGKFIRTMAMRLREARAGARLKTHRAIAEAAAAQLRQGFARG
jgi:SAM-dependent methyltransferase